jgi:hypothetical protein
VEAMVLLMEWYHALAKVTWVRRLPARRTRGATLGGARVRRRLQ